MTLRTFALSALLAAVPTFTFAATDTPTSHAEAGIAWYQGNVDSAFDYAKAHHKPLFLYWGAVWCPPCNQVKATVFNRQDFIARSRFFVPLHLDGDDPSAQKLGARFKVRGYPTMILFRPDGTEITRLPGEVDGERYVQVLTLGMRASMNAGHSVKETLQTALSGKASLPADDWRLLAYYAWDTDEQQLLAAGDLPVTLQRLAAACPVEDAAVRLNLSALAAAAAVAPKQTGAINQDAANTLLLKTLGDAHAARDNMDLLTNSASDIVALVSTPQSARRAQLSSAWNTALQRLADDATLSKADRLSAVDAQVMLARLAAPQGPLAPALLQQARQAVAAADHATTDLYERQSVIYSASEVLTDAGLIDESDTLLKAELTRSHAPYYFMLKLAANAHGRGDDAGALNWYEQAYHAAKGPATRLQWGTTYLNGLLDLAPNDEQRIEQVAGNLIREAGATPNAFYERNRNALEKLGRKLASWNAAGRHEAVFQRVRKQMNGVCAKLPANDPQRPVCDGVLSPAQS